VNLRARSGSTHIDETQVPARKKPPASPVWAYAYHIDPPLPESRLAEVRRLLDAEHAAATDASRKWEGRFVVEEHVTHILVVSDSLDQGRAINREVEAALRRVTTTFEVTVPLVVIPPPVSAVPAARTSPLV
jgi:hypothetical protein